MSHDHEHSDTQSVLRAYFKDLDAALSGLPRAKRKQLAGEIREHVDEMLTEQPPGSPAGLRNLLDRVGRPEDIAAAALDEEPRQARPPMRTWQKALIAGAGVVVLAGVGTGLGLALSSPKAPAGSPARSLKAPASSPAASGTPTAHRAVPSPSASSESPTAAVVNQAAGPARPGAAAGTPPAPPSARASASAGAAADLAVLAPATVPPVSAECTEQVTYDADGNVSPRTCANGGVNTVAWHTYAYGQSGATPNSSTLLRLGRYASPAQVYQAMCHDYAGLYKTKPITEDAEQLARAYYGWKFAGGTPLQQFEIDGCPPASRP